MFARGCLCRTADRTLVQVEWIGNADGKTVEDGRAYQFAAYAVTGDKLTVQMLNTGVVSKDIKTSQALAGAIAAHKDKLNLFNDATVYTKISP